MIESIQNFASKKFGAMLFLLYILWDTGDKRPELTHICLYLACGIAVAYSILEVVDKYLERKKVSNGLPGQATP